MTQCPECNTHIRLPGNTIRPVGAEVWFFFPPEKRQDNGGRAGWWSNAGLKVPILQNQLTTAPLGEEYLQQEREEDMERWKKESKPQIQSGITLE